MVTDDEYVDVDEDDLEEEEEGEDDMMSVASEPNELHGSRVRFQSSHRPKSEGATPIHTPNSASTEVRSYYFTHQGMPKTTPATA